MANKKNQRGKARDSDPNARGPMRDLIDITDKRTTLGITAAEKSHLKKADANNLAKGYKEGSIEARNKYGEDHCGDMPGLGERTKQSRRTTSIKHRHLS